MAEIKSLTAVLDPEQSLKFRYEAIIDYMLANPSMKQNEIADLIGCTAPWLSQIVNSKGFQARYHIRRMELNEDQNRAISAKVYEIASKGADRVLKELEKEEDCDANFALDASARALRSIGFGAPLGRPAHTPIGAPAGAEDATEINAAALTLARQAIESRALTLTRTTERVEISSSDRSEGGRVFESDSSFYPDPEVDG